MVPTPPRWTYGMGEHIRVQSLPGLFVLFPAWLQHYVVAHEGAGTRVSVSFNARVTYPAGEEDERGGGYVGSGGAAGGPGTAAAGATAAAPKLSFVVPAHHQEAFRDSKLAKDMRIAS